MFKAVENLREQKGFTLIELLIVIAIIGILAAIAVPAFLGQREKAKLKQVEASCKGAVSEIQSSLDSFIMQEPIVALDTSGNECCYEADDPASGKTCAAMFAGVTQCTDYDTADVLTILDIILDHHQGKGEKSIYSSGYLFRDTQTAIAAGTARLSNTTGKSIKITCYGPSTVSTDFIFNTVVTAR